MRKKLHFIWGGLLLLAVLFPIKTQAEVYWTDESIQPDTTWYTDHKDLTEYTITTAKELAGLAVLVNTHLVTFENKTVKLGNSISLQATVAEESVRWKPIGYYEHKKGDIRFKGVFDGQGYTIDYMVVNTTLPSNGLFGATLNAEIKNLTIGSNSSVTSTRECSAGIVGYAEKTRILNCINNASVTEKLLSNVDRAGGIAGMLTKGGYISDCVNNGTISNAYSCGGIVGTSSTGDTIVNCVNKGKIAPGGGLYAGGIIGYAYVKTSIVNCINMGIVEGATASYIGGIFGLSYNLEEIRNCINLGAISGTSTKLGVIGGATQGTFKSIRNFSLENAVTGSPAANTIIVSEVTEAQIKSQNFAEELTAYAGYLNKNDNTNRLNLAAWNYTSGEYPSFSSQKASDTYQIDVAATLLGDITLDVLSADDPNSLYIIPNTIVDIPIVPYSGYLFSGIELNNVYWTGSTFTMPEEDVTLVAIFTAGTETTWADMAQYAVLGSDYKKSDQYTYDIYTAKGLAYVAQEINNGNMDEETLINLAEDIDLGVENAEGDTLLWIPAGSDTQKFSGIFDGKGFTVNNMIINSTTKYSGFFGYAEGAEIKNVSVASNSRITSTEQYTAAIAGYATGTIFSNCHNAADVNVTASKTYTGGIAGHAVAGSAFSICSNSGNITSKGLLTGGIAGGLGNNNGIATIINSYNTGSISASGTSGGITGMLQSPTSNVGKSMIANCYNTADIIVTGNMAGGIAGSINKYSEVKNCLSSATLISSTNKSGGIVGSVAVDGILIRSYYQKGTVKGVDISQSGDSLSLEDLQSSALATEMTGFAGYINNIELANYVQWTSTSGEYVKLEASNTKASNAYILTVKAPLNGTVEMIKPSAVFATDSNTIFVKSNTQVTFESTPDEGYVFFALDVNGVTQTEYSLSFRTSATDTEVEPLFSRPRRWDFFAPNAVENTDYTVIEGGYEVHTNLGLAWISDNINKGVAMEGTNIFLTADIDLGEKNADNEDIYWASMGTNSSTSFKGNFDGKGYKIKNMMVKATSGYGGLFGYVYAGTIANVTITGNSSVTGSSYLGAVAGYITSNSVIMNCNNDGCSISATSNYTGGIAGNVDSNCMILNCSNNSGVTSTNNYAGGIAGYLQGKIINCLNTGMVTTANKGGGIIGDGYNLTVMRSYRIKGNVTGATTENILGTEIIASVSKTALLANELSAYAGYYNRTKSGELNIWVFGESPMVGTVKATDAYSVTITEGLSEHGSIRLPEVISTDDPTEFLANSESNIQLTVASDFGYGLILKANDQQISHIKGCFVMPEEDIVLTAEFSEDAYIFETWIEAAYKAVEDTDYKLSDGNYEIYSPYGFAYIANLVNEGSIAEGVSISLMADIDFGVENVNGDTLLWIPVGTEAEPFKGKFDGNGYIINNMIIKFQNKYAGLFGYVNGAEFENIHIGDGSRITNIDQYTAALVGYANDTRITNCSNAATIHITENKLYTGGIAGGAYGTSVITNCSNTGNIITAGGSAAGIAGALGNTSSTCHLANCINSGDIRGEKTSVGGIVGMMQGNRSAGDTSVFVTLSNSVNSGNISGSSMVGGITGFMGALYIKNCVNYGMVSAPGGKSSIYAGAITGYINNAVLLNGGCQFFRNYALENMTTNPEGTIIEDSKTELSVDIMTSAELVAELSRYAGYLSSREKIALLSWESGNTGYPVLSREKSNNAYAVSISEELANDEKGTVLLPEMISINDSVYYAHFGGEITLRIEPIEGYEIDWLKANEIIIANGIFTMPSEDVVIDGAFSHVFVPVGENKTELNKVWIKESTLYIEINEDAANLTIITMDGRIMLNEQASYGVHTYSLSTGVYLVKVSNQAHKAVVK